MADKFLWIIYYIVYAAELFLIGDGIFHNRVKEKAKYAVMVGIYLLVMIPTVLFLNNNVFVMLALNLLMYIVLFQGTLFSQIVHFTGVYLLTNMAESMVFGIGMILWYPSRERSEMNVVESGGFSLFFAVVITGFLLYIVKRKWTQNFILYFRALNWFQYLVIAMIVWSGILLLGIITVMPAYIGEQKESAMLFGRVILFMGAALVGVILLVLNGYGKDYYLKQNKMKEEIICVQQMYYQNIYDNDREMRRFRHDIHSQLNCLGLLLADGKTEEALEHLQMIGNHFGELTMQKYHTGNEILDVILNHKIQEAEKKGIRIEFAGKMEKPDFMDTYDLCTLFSNMLDNCIEASETAQTREAAITVSVLTHRNTMLFRFTNPATAEMYEAVKRGKTTKADRENHGFGMENIQRVVRKNRGETAYSFKDGKLIVEMFFEI
ncbi:MAG: GHKL domain-containing protein [Lachnospiraceae bacterium]|nr:GHKL domain-containing protein [Lachnospiraceae bacterium]